MAMLLYSIILKIRKPNKSVIHFNKYKNYSPLETKRHLNNCKFLLFQLFRWYTFLKTPLTLFIASICIVIKNKGKDKKFFHIWPHPYILLLCANYSIIIVAVFFLNENVTKCVCIAVYIWHWWHLRRSFIFFATKSFTTARYCRIQILAPWISNRRPWSFEME